MDMITLAHLISETLVIPKKNYTLIPKAVLKDSNGPMAAGYMCQSAKWIRGQLSIQHNRGRAERRGHSFRKRRRKVSPEEKKSMKEFNSAMNGNNSKKPSS
jgi:hypothetical protein